MTSSTPVFRADQRNLPQISKDSEGVSRCAWANATPELQYYHDTIMGKMPQSWNESFGMLSLELLQSGLSWRTIWYKKDALYEAFEGFDVQALAQFSSQDVQRLMHNSGIVRHQGKINAILSNAGVFLRLMALHASFEDWLFALLSLPRGAFMHDAALLKLVKEMKAQGFAYIGKETMRSYLQACGMLEFHAPECAFSICEQSQ